MNIELTHLGSTRHPGSKAYHTDLNKERNGEQDRAEQSRGSIGGDQKCS